jgi:hypothetical protein
MQLSISVEMDTTPYLDDTRENLMLKCEILTSLNGALSAENEQLRQELAARERSDQALRVLAANLLRHWRESFLENRVLRRRVHALNADIDALYACISRCARRIMELCVARTAAAR